MTNVKVGMSVLILIVIILNSFSVSAITGSIGNARVILYPEVGPDGLDIDRTILVKNVNDIAINVSLEASEEFLEIVEIIDSEFILQPGTEKKAKFVIRLKEAGDYEGKINVFFKPAEGKGAGVALSSTIIIYAKSGNGSSTDYSENDDGNLDGVEDEMTDKEGSSFNFALLLFILPTFLLIAVLLFLFSRMKSNGAKTENEKRKNGEKVKKTKRADRSA